MDVWLCEKCDHYNDIDIFEFRHDTWEKVYCKNCDEAAEIWIDVTISVKDV